MKTNAQLDLEYKLKLFEFLTAIKPEKEARFLKTHSKYEDVHWFNEHKPRTMRLRQVRASEYRPNQAVMHETPATHVLARKVGPTACEKMFITLTNAENIAQYDDILLSVLWKASVGNTKDSIDLNALIAAHANSVAQPSEEA